MQEADATRLSLLRQLPQPLQGTQGGGQQDQDIQFGVPVFPEGLMPSGNGLSPGCSSGPNLAPWPLPDGFLKVIQAGPLSVHSDWGTSRYDHCLCLG